MTGRGAKLGCAPVDPQAAAAGSLRNQTGMFISQAFAQDAAAGGTAAVFMQILPLVLIFGVFYFLLIRPQQKKQREHRELLQKLKRGEPVDPKLIYFRTVPRFETGHDKYRWLMEHIFVGSAARHADRVVIDVHQVM